METIEARGVTGLRLAEDWRVSGYEFVAEYTARGCASIDSVLCAAFHAAWWRLQHLKTGDVAAFEQAGLWDMVFLRAMEDEGNG